jgi:hypothetical protein
MDVPFLTSVMGTLTVVATYYWAGRPDIRVIKRLNWQANVPSARPSPPYWSNEWV